MQLPRYSTQYSFFIVIKGLPLKRKESQTLQHFKVLHALHIHYILPHITLLFQNHNIVFNFIDWF